MKRILRIHPTDNVVVALEDIHVGDVLCVDGQELTALDDVRFGHKLAITAMSPGESVTKYGASIGLASQPVQPGEHVHAHNLISVRGSVER